MKKVLLEYASMIGYTVTGLVFGVAFFLLFINFYHSQEFFSHLHPAENRAAQSASALL